MVAVPTIAMAAAAPAIAHEHLLSDWLHVLLWHNGTPDVATQFAWFVNT
jgi:hypothetical protein